MKHFKIRWIWLVMFTVDLILSVTTYFATDNISNILVLCSLFTLIFYWGNRIEDIITDLEGECFDLFRLVLKKKDEDKDDK